MCGRGEGGGNPLAKVSSVIKLANQPAVKAFRNTAAAVAKSPALDSVPLRSSEAEFSGDDGDPPFRCHRVWLMRDN